MTMPCVIFVANRGFALYSSRLLLIRHFLDRGWRVIIATADDQFSRQLVEEGASLEPIKFNRGGLSPLRDYLAFLTLKRIFSKYRPVLVHHFHAKPIIFGSLALKSSGIANAKIVNTITGLGHAFVQGVALKKLAGLGYKLVLPMSSLTIFQNSDDKQLFLTQGWISEDKAELIISSGVDISRFTVPSHGPPSPPTILMVGRLLWQKGVGEFIEAARGLKKRFPSVRFQLAGEFDPSHPDGISERELQQIIDDNIIEFLGYVRDMPRLLASSYLFVLPSYREGVPRVILEAAACSVPTVGADVPGTREAVVDGETGFLVPPRDSRILAQRIQRLIENKEERDLMGKKARKRVEHDFDIVKITEHQLNIYRKLGLSI